MTQHHLAMVAMSVSLVFGGLVGGLAYFAVLRRTAELIAAGRGWLGSAAALTGGRIAGMVLLLAIVARLGAAPLLALWAGFLMARAIALRQARITP